MDTDRSGLGRVADLLGAGASLPVILDAVAGAAIELGFRSVAIRIPPGSVVVAGHPTGRPAGPVTRIPLVYAGQRCGTLVLGAPTRPTAAYPRVNPTAYPPTPARTLAALAAVAVHLGQAHERLAARSARVDDLRTAVDALTDAARADPLTGLANRAYLDERLRQALSRGARQGRPVGVLLLDLDDFKAVNDTFGHAAGDAVLREVGRRLRACTRPEDTAARLGGDEFVLVLEDQPADPGAAGAAVASVAARVADAAGVSVHGRPIGVSVGYAVGRGGDDPDALVARADAAMYRVKRARAAVRRPARAAKTPAPT